MSHGGFDQAAKKKKGVLFMNTSSKVTIQYKKGEDKTSSKQYRIITAAEDTDVRAVSNLISDIQMQEVHAMYRTDVKELA